jgi:hypothetical protein
MGVAFKKFTQDLSETNIDEENPSGLPVGK